MCDTSQEQIDAQTYGQADKGKSNALPTRIYVSTERLK